MLLDKLRYFENSSSTATLLKTVNVLQAKISASLLVAVYAPALHFTA